MTDEGPQGTPATVLWEIRGVEKAFPGVQALAGVSLTLRVGEVHALVGENGSGKSTLVNCLAGVIQPDKGQLIHQGDPVRMRGPAVAYEHGVATFHQELSLVPSLPVTENVCLGRWPQRRGVIDWDAARQQARKTLAEFEIELPLDVPVRSLSVAEQQFAELAKAISRDMSLLILDEPTTALGPSETAQLHRVIARLARDGRTILYVSHRLDEVLAAADRVTVMKDGRVVGTHDASSVTLDQVVRMMVGADLGGYFPSRIQHGTETRVRVQDVVSEGGVQGATFTIARGEILGLAGIAGAGRTAVARALYGVDRIVGGQLIVDGEQLQLRNPTDAIASGIGLVSEDRKLDGLFFNLGIAPNVTVVDLRQLSRMGVLQLRRERSVVMALMDKLRITGNVMDESVLTLSGGNQQKIVLARWLFSGARLLILDEPTRGIDVSAKVEVYNVLNELSAAGLALLLISSDFAELLAMSDRICVIRGGRVVHESPSGHLTEHQLVEMAAGGEAP